MPTGWSSWGIPGSRGPEAAAPRLGGAQEPRPEAGGDQRPRKVLKCYLKTDVLEPCLMVQWPGAERTLAVSPGSHTVRGHPAHSPPTTSDHESPARSVRRMQGGRPRHDPD